jgi:hypothetical protein
MVKLIHDVPHKEEGRFFSEPWHDLSSGSEPVMLPCLVKSQAEEDGFCDEDGGGNICHPVIVGRIGVSADK